MNAESRFKYTVNVMYIEQDFVNVEIDFIDAEKRIHSFRNSNMKKHSDLVFKIRKQEFTWCFMRKQGKFF